MKFPLYCFTIALMAEAGSWDSYIDALISQSWGSADKACILGLDSGVKWTTDQHPNALKLTKNEAETIAKCCRSRNLTQFIEEGVCAEGVCYFFKVAYGNVVMASRIRYGSLTLGPSRKAIVIAHTAEGKSKRNTFRAVKTIVEYLEGFGY